MKKKWRLGDDESWTFKFRPDQVDVLRLLIVHCLSHCLKEINVYNKEWLPSRLATVSLQELLDYINDVTG